MESCKHMEQVNSILYCEALVVTIVDGVYVSSKLLPYTQSGAPGSMTDMGEKNVFLFSQNLNTLYLQSFLSQGAL